MTRDAKEFLVIDRTHEDIQIHRKKNKSVSIKHFLFQILFQMSMELFEDLSMESSESSISSPVQI